MISDSCWRAGAPRGRCTPSVPAGPRTVESVTLARTGQMIDKARSRVHGPPASMPSFSERPARPHGRGPSSGMSRRGGIYRVSPDVASRVTAGHPWVFRDALGSRELVEPTGTVVDIFSGNRDFIARGLGSIAARFTRAVQLRWMLFGAGKPDSMRLFAGDSEGLPGVNVDRHGDFVVVQWLSAGAFPWRDELLDAIDEAVRPRGIYEQRRVRPRGGQAPAEPAVRARGEEAPLEVIVEEAGCRFGIDVTAPLCVGIFPDLRLGRAAVAARAANRRVLSLFSYTGAFSVYAAKAGAAV